MSPKKIYKWSIPSEKMLNITGHQGNANQNNKEISLHTHEDGYNQKHISVGHCTP